MGRLGSLDALRGLSAVIVLLHHCVMSITGLREWFQASIVLRPLVAGPSAVLIFFVLSGFVLYAAFEKHDRFAYMPYLLKRIARIYPPLVASIALSLGLYLLVAPTPSAIASDWFNGLSWHVAPTPEIVKGHLLMFDGTSYQSLNNVTWSLTHEMRMMFAFPLIALGVRRHAAATLAVTLCMSLGAMLLVTPSGPLTVMNPLATLQYTFLFAAGAALARHADAVSAVMSGPTGRIAGPALLAIGVVSGLMVGRTAAVGAICLVAVCASYAPVVRALNRAPLRWLGKVSYSLYLTHLLVLLTAIHVLQGVLPVVVILPLVVVASLFVAGLGYRFIEMPAMVLGRRLATSRAYHDDMGRTLEPAMPAARPK